MYVILVGANHKTAPVEMREKLSFAREQMQDVYDSLLSDSCLKECIIISTCNRTEVYAASRDIEAALERINKFLSDQSGMDFAGLHEHLYELTCRNAIEHLFRVTAGPRVIEQTIKEKLPKGFQRSEFLLEHGMLDEIVERANLQSYLSRALHLFMNLPQ